MGTREAWERAGPWILATGVQGAAEPGEALAEGAGAGTTTRQAAAGFGHERRRVAAVMQKRGAEATATHNVATGFRQGLSAGAGCSRCGR